MEEKEKLIFIDWEQRSSSLGALMTNLDAITELEKQELKDLLIEEKTGLNANGNKAKWTDTKIARVKTLHKKEKGDLPSGAITHLDEVFRNVFWKRRRFLANKQLEKGTLQEHDAISDLRDYEKLIGNSIYMEKNGFYKSNGYTNGTEDVVTDDHVWDTKCSFDLQSFDEKDEPTTDNVWQMRDYCWRNNKKSGYVAYVLVNNPVHQLINEKNRLFYAMGNPPDDDEDYIEALCQLERNMIFDIPKFQKDYPNYTFLNKELNFSIPLQFRVKKFKVEVTDEDILNIKLRVTMGRKYLVEKELAHYEKAKQFNK